MSEHNKENRYFCLCYYYKDENYFIDKELINELRKFNKEIFVIINKDDNFKQDKKIDNLGIKNIFISCSHNIGIDVFLNFIKIWFPDNKLIKYDFSIGLFGKTNVGVPLNKLVGFERSIVSNQPKLQLILFLLI